MESWVKISDNEFLVKEGTVQPSLGSHATIILNIDIKKYPEYEEIFFKMFERSEIFSIFAKHFQGNGTRIKAIDIDRNSEQMILSLRCDILESKSIDERRDELINVLLDIETLDIENNIN